MLHSKGLINRSLILTVLVLVAALLNGCSALGPTQKPSEQAKYQGANEALLKAADNHAGLIELYKTRMQKGEPAERDRARLELGQVYLDTGDPESTLFTIEPLFLRTVENGEGRPDAEGWLLKSRAQLALGQPTPAMESIKQALALRPGHPHILNQSGLIYAETGNYSEARQAFIQARHAMLDDLTVKNNLAMLDILEENYKAAIQRLMPLYTSGQADDRIKANLTLAVVRAGLYQEFRTLCGQGKTEQETAALFMALSEAKPAAGVH
ncbi:tetratricopeptide repeat protein [Parendozoicomonas haliclonae]|uniref:Tetratricopeptide repeat protein n=1 Tax=Parendozoicomonas haliclonae TaxID=1960125 RepID=A0A1X7AMP3_9GAMM|nr:tetratricopeptide repeat protein [Parendozoicomonas haliclonae]SMA47548.1 Tetratricopeptide repeat protein [Parendozoicomonas haliclonae]